MADKETGIEAPPAIVEKDKAGVERTRPKRIIRDKETGRLLLDDGTGWAQPIRSKDQFVDVELSKRVEELMGNPEVDRSKMAVKLGERLTINWFGNNPEGSKAFLVKKGYTVRQTGPGPWDFSAKLSPDDTWGEVDPTRSRSLFSKDGMYEFGIDMLEFLGHAAMAVPETAAGIVGFAAGGPWVSAAAAGAVGSAKEYAREKIGSALGIENNVDPATIAVSGALSAIPTQGGGSAIRGAGRVAGELTEEMGAMLTRSKPSGSLSARDVYVARAMDPASRARPWKGAVEKLPSPAMGARDLRNAVRSVYMKEVDISQADPDRIILSTLRNPDGSLSKKVMEFAKMKEFDQADAILDQMPDETIKLKQLLAPYVNMTLPDEQLGKEAFIKVRSQATGNPKEAIGNLLDTVYGFVQRTPGSDIANLELSLKDAKELNRLIQKRGLSVGGFDDKVKEGAVVKAHEELQGKIADAIEQAADSAMDRRGVVGPKYSTLMWQGKRKLDKLDKKVGQLGLDIRNDEEAGEAKAVGYVLGLHGNRQSAAMDAAAEFERDFGIPLIDPSKRALIGTLIGDEGSMGVMPRVTATGGVPFVAERGLGLLQFAAGLSPRNVIRLRTLAGIAAEKTAPVRHGAVATLNNPAGLLALQGMAQHPSAAPDTIEGLNEAVRKMKAGAGAVKGYFGGGQ